MSDSDDHKYMSVWGVAALGIGSMVGAGIFALLGQASLVAGNGIYTAFILGGIMALLSGYTYIKLGIRYPGSGGILDYYNKAFVNKRFSGALCLVYWVTLIISAAMIAKSFGAYATQLFASKFDHPGLWHSIFSTAIIMILGFLNMSASKAVSKSEIILVLVKLCILGALMVASFGPVHTFKPGEMPPATWSGIFSAVGLTFFAFAGYGMMANAAGSLKNPHKSLPRAIFLAIGIVLVLYLTLAYVVLTNVPMSRLENHAETAIAQAAYPVLGQWGFVAVSIAALVATASAINADFFSMIRIANGLAADGQIMSIFKKPFMSQGSQGFFWTLVFIALFTNMFRLDFIANVASACFLISYLGVFVANWKLRKETETPAFPIIIGFFLMLFLLGAFLYQVAQTQWIAVVLIPTFIILCFVFEYWLGKRSAASKK